MRIAPPENIRDHHSKWPPHLTQERLFRVTKTPATNVQNRPHPTLSLPLVPRWERANARSVLTPDAEHLTPNPCAYADGRAHADGYETGRRACAGAGESGLR